MLSRNFLFLSSRLFSNTVTFRYNHNINNVKSFNKTCTILTQLIYRKYSGANTNPAPEEQFKDVSFSNLKEFKTKNCPVIKYITPTLQKLLGLDTTQVKELIQRCSKLKSTTNNTVEKNYQICCEAGITNDVLIKYPVILTLDLLKIKIEYLQELDIDINLIAPMVIANVSDLKRIVTLCKAEEKYIPYRNRVVYLSKILDVPAPEISEKVINHIFVFRIPFERLQESLKVFLKYGIESRNILNDCWALRYSPKIAEERLEKAIIANVSKVKTWMIRCQEKVFERCINRQIENRNILGDHSSVEEYLSKRLECSIENAKYLTEKYPAIRKMNILKMKETLDFLYEQGYSPSHVCRVPRIMIHSQETTKQRIQQLKQLGYIPPSLAILCKSKRDFDKILKKYIKRKKTSEKGTNEE